MMKKLFIYGTVVLMTLTSCNDLFGKEPLDTFSNAPEHWSNTDNLENQCNTSLNNYSGYENGSGGGWFYFKTLDDDQVDNDSHTQVYISVIAKSSNWPDPFVETRRVAYIVEGARSSFLDNIVRANYEGIARLNRAWEYFQLVCMYGNVQWIDKVIDSDDKETLLAERIDRDIVMGNVPDDLKCACENMTGADKQRFNKDMALAMATDIRLWEDTFCKYRTQNENGKAADNTRAQKFLQECIIACGALIAKNCKLREDYQFTYNSADPSKDTETIFCKPYSEDASMHSTIGYTVNTSGTRGMSKDAFDSYLLLDGKPLAATEENTNDVITLVNGEYSLTNAFAAHDKRLAVTIDPVLTFRGHVYSRAGVTPSTASTGYGVVKLDNMPLDLYNRNQIGTAYTDAPIYWLPTIYLNYTEARVELGTLTQLDLNNTINKLQTRAGLPDMTTTPVDDPANNMGVSNLIWETRRCRRCELMSDNWHRYWDLIRWRQLELLDSKKYSNVFLGANLENVANPEETLKGKYLNASDGQNRIYERKHYLYLIPTGQLTLNKNTKQNLDWEIPNK